MVINPKNPTFLVSILVSILVDLICVFYFGDFFQSLIANEDFQHILRVLNTNVDGKQKIMFALTSIKGIGRRFANIVCKKADVDMNKRFFSISTLGLSSFFRRWVLLANFFFSCILLIFIGRFCSIYRVFCLINEIWIFFLEK